MNWAESPLFRNPASLGCQNVSRNLGNQFQVCWGHHCWCLRCGWSERVNCDVTRWRLKHLWWYLCLWVVFVYQWTSQAKVRWA